ncbi:peptide chain release factor N(5)-glutamine methyltransferase [Pseudolactococcus insecticola]|uniref:Release factor glutamine methyltransferase n=1 Tax=Pseudolactococcus insecticola TaxID=2709158 RepID=A0A6A0B586_9LACT|nr:peptide chain release factor N(5)-glutamine methyltransferase [Lactococcus insecticola]GFH39648.1 release factor glutamine methyltransferase [Lactococcus insecticola]
MTYLQTFQQYEQELARPEELRYVFRYARHLSYTDLIMMLNSEITPADAAFLAEIAKRLLADEPAQYIVGETEFYGLTVNVDARALIPRPETEELVALILAENNGRDSLKVLDIGTGTGVIALSLAKKQPTWQVTATDISSEALDLARENTAKNGIANLTFQVSDVFDNLSGKYDIIISNPPYIADFEAADMAKNVLDYEPHLALFAENDGFAIYQKIAEKSAKFLSQTGKIYLEIGYLQGARVRQIFKEQLPEKRIRVLKDLSGKDRMIAID